MIFGKRLKELRKESKMTQTELAKVLGITKGTISTWETGSRTPPFEQMIAICDLYSVSLDYLAGRVDKDNDDKSEKKTGTIVIIKCDDEQLGRILNEI